MTFVIAAAPRGPESYTRGLDKLINAYSRATTADRVIIAYASPCRDVAALVVSALRTQLVECLLEPLQPLESGHDLAKRVFKHVPPRARIHSHVVIMTMELDTMTGSEDLKAAATPYGSTLDLVRIIGAIPEFLELAAACGPEELTSYNSGLLHRVMNQRYLRILSDSGTDLRVTLDSRRFSWLSNSGRRSPGVMTVLPAGEINTYPASLSGVFVAEGAINVNRRVDFDARLGAHPVTCHFDDNILTKFECTNRDLNAFLRAAFARPFATSVGELGFGTNSGITRFISANSHINERHPGVHIGLGEHVAPGKVSYQSDIHIDLISSDSYILLQAGQELHLDQLQQSSLPHPEGLRSEDVDGND